jgi:hypothetical protein
MEDEKLDAELCAVANSNPHCPYIMMIKEARAAAAENKEDMQVLKTALVGTDLQGGIVKRLLTIEERLKHRWSLKDWGALFLGVAALITALAAWWPK